MDINKVDQKMKSWLIELGDYIQKNTDYSIDEKQDFRDLVSEVDITVEQKLTTYIRTLPGEQTILGEESHNSDVDFLAEHLWVIDPIDGTSNFIKQKDDYGILVAYFQKGEPLLSYIYEVETNTLISAKKDAGVFLNDSPMDKPQNRHLNEALISINPRKMNGTNLLSFLAQNAFDLRFLGSSVSDATRVISGKYGAFISPESMPWDRAPYLLIADELSLQMSQFNGEPSTIIGDENFFLGTKAIFKDVFQSK